MTAIQLSGMNCEKFLENVQVYWDSVAVITSQRIVERREQQIARNE